MTLSAAALNGWDCNVFDAQSAYLQSDGHRETNAVADASQKSASWDENRASVCCHWFDLRDERRWTYEHSKKVLEAAGFVMARVEHGLYCLHGPSGLEAVVHTHVDDFLVAFKKASKKYKDALQHLVHELHLKQQSGTVVYCGRTISRDGNHINVTADQVNDEPRMYEHRSGLTNSGKPSHER